MRKNMSAILHLNGDPMSSTCTDVQKVALIISCKFSNDWKICMDQIFGGMYIRTQQNKMLTNISSERDVVREDWDFVCQTIDKKLVQPISEKNLLVLDQDTLFSQFIHSFKTLPSAQLNVKQLSIFIKSFLMMACFNLSQRFLCSDFVSDLKFSDRKLIDSFYHEHADHWNDANNFIQISKFLLTK